MAKKTQRRTASNVAADPALAPVTTAAVSEVAEPEGRTRVYVLRSMNGGENNASSPTRYIEATSKTAAMLYVANALYSIDAASGKDLREAWKAGASMESAA